ncbi:MAG TPA: hypothetical protein VFP84_33210, partial [Kofleriaceae bacterium]|nr:hypothetical protein [Kofleriaceae bacterium]
VVPEGRLARTEAIAISGAGRPWRLSAGLGGGLAFDHGTHGLLRLDARFEHGYRTRLGAEAALWLVDGDAQGRVLATLARGLGHGLAIGVGAGVHVGADTGVAAGLRLRLPTPLPWLDGVLRYDAAVLLSRPRVEAEHAISLGLEIAY